MTAWVRHETSWPPAAASNPLDSTLPEPGSTIFNTIVLAGGGVIHVQNYPDAAEGAAATAATIANGHYPRIIAALRRRHRPVRRHRPGRRLHHLVRQRLRRRLLTAAPYGTQDKEKAHERQRRSSHQPHLDHGQL